MTEKENTKNHNIKDEHLSQVTGGTSEEVEKDLSTPTENPEIANTDFTPIPIVKPKIPKKS